MSAGKSNKRISVFDRLGPGNDHDESSTKHRRYSSEKHTGSAGSQDKVRSHAYVSSVAASHLHIEDSPSSSGNIRERKARHRGSMGDYPTPLADEEILEDTKRTPNPPPMKSSRDVPEALKSVGVKVSRGPPTGGPLASGESDYESGEEEKRRKSYRSDHSRLKHDIDILEEDSNRRSSRLPPPPERKDKGHGIGHADRHIGGHPDRPSSNSNHRSSPTSDITGKGRSRRDGGTEHKRRKEEEQRISSELGHKRKREHFEDVHLPDLKRVRHGDYHSSRDVDHHHSNSSKESDHYHGNIREDHHHHGSQDRKRRQDSTLTESISQRDQHSWSPGTISSTAAERGGRSGNSRGYKSTTRENKKPMPDLTEHTKGRSGGGKITKTLDWATITSLTDRANTKLRDYPRTILSRFNPGATFANINVSPSLTSADSYQRIVDLVKDHVKIKNRVGLQNLWAELLRGTSHEDKLDWDKAVSENLSPCRRALIASDDYTLRRLLRKLHHHRDFLAAPPPPPPPPPPAAVANPWDTRHYEIVLKLYQDIPAKPTGKPAFRLQPSKMGTLLI